MSAIVQHLINRPVPTIAVTTSTSISGAAVSFAEQTLPLLQWGAAAVAFVSGVLGILLAAYHLKVIFKKEYLTPK